eukprot:COSAG05_NODE_1880_length_3909_cov_1.531234_4_plen_60_part_00
MQELAQLEDKVNAANARAEQAEAQAAEAMSALQATTKSWKDRFAAVRAAMHTPSPTMHD